MGSRTNCRRLLRWFIPLCLVWRAILSHERFRSLATASYRGEDGIPIRCEPSIASNGASGLGRLIADTISCSSVHDNVRNGHWPDPNGDAYYVRRTIDPPTFYISVHSKDYDLLRYITLFEEGQYYETQVIQRFHKILGEAPKDSIVIDVGANIGFYTLLSASLGHVVRL